MRDRRQTVVVGDIRYVRGLGNIEERHKVLLSVAHQSACLFHSPVVVSQKVKQALLLALSMLRGSNLLSQRVETFCS